MKFRIIITDYDKLTEEQKEGLPIEFKKNSVANKNDRLIWFSYVEINSMEEILNYIEKYNDIILRKYSNGLYEIEIYNGYRE